MTIKTLLLGCSLGCSIFISSMTVADDFSRFSVVDGDTIKAEWNIPHPMLQQVYFRIIGMDAPELFHPKCEKERMLAKQAKNALTQLLDNGFHYEIISWDKYGGRILIKAYHYNDNISDLFIQQGLAVPYAGEKKQYDWCDPPLENK